MHFCTILVSLCVLVITADFVRERRKTVLGLHSFVCLVLAVIYSYVDQKLTSCTSVGVSGSRMWSVVGCFAGGLGRARGSCGWVSRARTLSTWRATSSAAAGAVFVRSQSSVMHMRTRSPRAAAAIQATAIMDGGTRRNSVSVDKERLHKHGQLIMRLWELSWDVQPECSCRSGLVVFVKISECERWSWFLLLLFEWK